MEYCSMIDNINRVILKSIKQVYDFIRIKSIYYAHEGTFITLWGYIIILIIAYQCFQIHTWRNKSETIRPWKRMSDKIVWLLNHVFSSKNSHYHNWQCLWPFIRKNVLTFALYQFHFTSKVRFRNKSMTHILRKIRPWSKVLLKAISIYYADTFVSWTQIMRLLWYP